jgi:DNA-binding response OmpR family regulator
MTLPKNGEEVVLIVEDDEDTAEMLRKLLDVMGYASNVASNGKVGLDYLRDTPTKYCLVLLDIMMPVMDGWGFLKEHRGDSTISGIPVIIVTAALDAQAKVGGTNAVAFLPKPVDTGTLRAALQQYC